MSLIRYRWLTQAVVSQCQHFDWDFKHLAILLNRSCLDNPIPSFTSFADLGWLLSWVPCCLRLQIYWDLNMFSKICWQYKYIFDCLLNLNEKKFFIDKSKSHILHHISLTTWLAYPSLTLLLFCPQELSTGQVLKRNQRWSPLLCIDLPFKLLLCTMSVSQLI